MNTDNGIRVWKGERMRESKEHIFSQLLWFGGKGRSRKLALLMGAVLVFNNAGVITPYGAEKSEAKQIEEFKELPDDVLFQEVPYGTKKKDLKLPDMLRGFVVTETDTGDDTATPSDAEESVASPSEADKEENAHISTATPSTSEKSEYGGKDGQWKNIRVKWEIDVNFSENDEYDGENPGTYVFDAVLTRDTYELASAELPRITVEVLPNSKGKIITGWEWIDEQEMLSDGILALPGANERNKADFDIIASMLPEKIKAEVSDGGEKVPDEVKIEEWKCDNLPEEGAYEGEYVFEAVISEEYSLKDGTEPLEVKVQLGGANFYAASADQIMISGLTLDTVNKYAKVDARGTVVYGTDGDHSIYWDAGSGTLELTNVNISTVIDVAPSNEAVVLANRKEITIILNGENFIHVENNTDSSFAAVKNSGGGITVQKGDASSHFLSIVMENNGDFYSRDINGFFSADGFKNNADLEIDIKCATDEDIYVNMYGVQCGTYEIPAREPFENEGNIKISVDNTAIKTWYGSTVSGISINGAGMKNRGLLDISSSAVNGGVYGLYGNNITEQWTNYEEGSVFIESTAYGGNIPDTSVEEDYYFWSNYSCAVSVRAKDDIYVQNIGNMDLKAVNYGKNGSQEYGIGFEVSGNGEVILDNQGDLTTTALEGYSYGINISNSSGDSILKNSGVITASATTDGHELYEGGYASATGIAILSNGFRDKLGVTSIQAEQGGILTASTLATENMDSNDRDEVTAQHCHAVQLQKKYSKDPQYTELPQEIELDEGIMIRKGGKCFTIWLENYAAYNLWIYINAIGADERTGPAQYVEIGPAITPSVNWPEVELTYGESLAEAKVEGGEAFDENGDPLDGDFKWDNDTVAPTVKDSVTKTYRMSFKPSDVYGELYDEAKEDITITVLPKHLTLSMDVTPTEGKAGEDIALQANVSGTINGDIPAGKIRFSANNSVIAESPVNAGTLIASAVWKNPSAGTYTLKAEYIPALHDNYTGEKMISIEDYIVKNKIQYTDSSDDDSDYNVPVPKGQWIRDEIGWRWHYTNETSWAQGRKETDQEGNVMVYYRWEQINNAWFAFDADGYAKEGFLFDANYDGWFYVDINSGMKTGWQQINGKWYYFNPVSDGRRGVMLADAWIDGWYVDKNGIWNGKEKNN